MNFRICWIFFVLAIPVTGFGQIACISTPDTIGCAPHTVNVIYCGSDPASTFAYNWGETNGFDGNTSYTYESAGTFTITQFITSSLEPGVLTDTKEIRVVTRPEPEFELHPCAGRQLLVSLEDVGYDRYIIDYGDESSFDTATVNETPVHIYSDSLEKTVTVTGLYFGSDCSNSSSLTTFLFNSLQTPDLDYVKALNETSVEVSFKGFSHLEYALEHKMSGESTYNTGSRFYMATTETVEQVNISGPLDGSCFRVNNLDACGQSKVSPQVCALSVVASAANNQNTLSWESYSPIAELQDYTLVRNGEVVTNTLSTSFNDSDVVCGGQYCYQLRSNTTSVNSEGDPIFFLSDSSCVESFSTDTPLHVENLQASVVEGAPQPSWEVPNDVLPEAYQFRYGRFSFPFENEVITGPLPEESLGFTDLNPTQLVYCFEANYTDPCGNTTESASAPQVCTFLLNGTQETDGSFSLSWTAYEGFGNDLWEYVVKWQNGDGTVVQQQSAGTSTSFVDLTPPEDVQSLEYVICAIRSDGSQVTSNGVFFNQRSILYIPTAFSPNNDGLNDEFLAIGNFIESAELRVFNRWGELLFASEDLSVGWDGTYQGERVPFGAYPFTILYIDQNGKEFTKKGTVTVIY